ncbi:MAG: BACON domain-containing protein [Bacteroidales bacterium]|nr:BACON domain-containing protein [Bacteroidales bacterium]
MKAKYIILSLIASLAVLVGCEKEGFHFLDGLKVDSSYVSVPLAGGSNTIMVSSDASWTITDIPEWLTVSPASGSAGETTVAFSAAAALDGRETTVLLTSEGKTQRINVIQGVSVVSTASCAEVLAGPDSKTYRVTGTVTGIVNTTYGNWYLNDGTGEVYIYGTLDSKGNTKNFLSWGLEVGDEITVEGPKTTYNGTVELVDVTVIKINKSLIKVAEMDPEDATLPIEGGLFTVTLDNKGNGVYVDIPEDAQDWLSIASLAGNVVTFRVAENNGGDRETTIVFKTTDGKKEYTAQQALSQAGAIVEIVAGDFNALEDGNALFRLKGVVTGIVMDKNDPTKYNKYGNFYLNDETGKAYVYGLLPEAGGESGQDVLTAKGIKEGDILTVVGPKASYNGNPQMKNAYYVEHTSVTTITCADFNALADGADLFKITGTVSGIVMDKDDNAKYNKYGNFYVEDETGKVYVYGLVPTLSGQSGQDLLTKLGVKEGDTITVVGPKSSYKDSPQMKNAFYVNHTEAK